MRRHATLRQSTASTERLDSPQDQNFHFDMPPTTEEISGGTPYIPPPDYSTLDPLRLSKNNSRRDIHLPVELRRRQNSCRHCGSFFVLGASGNSSKTEPESSPEDQESDLEAGNASDLPGYCTNPQCPGESQITFVGSLRRIRSFHEPSSSRRGSLLLNEGSIRRSLRRSARRLVRAFSGGSTPTRGGRSTPPTTGQQVLVSHISQTEQSEA